MSQLALDFLTTSQKKNRMIIDVNRSFVDPLMRVMLPVNNLTLSKPERDLIAGILNGVRTVANVSSSDDGEISSDSSRARLEGISGTEKDSSSGDGGLALPDHTDNGAGEHVLDEVGEEGSLLEILVVLLEKLLGGVDELESSEVESSLLKPGNYGANESSLDTVGLDHDVGSFLVRVC